MELTSPAFENDETIPARYTCDGENISPPFEIVDIPDHTKSFAMTMIDPDAPNGTFIHWTLWNISPITTFIEEDAAPPEAIQGKNSAGQSKYMGPCPPQGAEHRYVFTLYALDTAIHLAEDAAIEKLEAYIENHNLAEAELIGRYGRT